MATVEVEGGEWWNGALATGTDLLDDFKLKINW